MKKILLILILGVFFSGCQYITDYREEKSTSPAVDYSAIEEDCTQAGGRYLSEFLECEDVSAVTCTELGGEFNECGSACRHEPEAAICTANCVPYCSFDVNNDTGYIQPESVLAQLNQPLKCNLMPETKMIDGIEANYICEAPGAYLTEVNTSYSPWIAGYFTTNTNGDTVTYDPNEIEVTPNLELN